MSVAGNLLNRLADRLVSAADRRRDAGNQPAAAAALYGLAYRAAPHRPDLLVQRGNMLKDAGRFRAAETAYRAAIDADPSNADPHLQLGRALALAGRTDEAVAAYEAALVLDPALGAAKEELDRLRPSSGVDEARAVKDERQRRVEDLLASANRQRDTRDFVAAATTYGEVLEIAPDRADVLIQCGNMLKDIGRLDEAERAYRAAAALTPFDALPFVGLGHLGNLRGDRDAARAAFKQAVALDPACDEARHELVMVGLPEHQEAAYLRRLDRGEQAAVEMAAHRIEVLEAEARRLRGSLRDILTRAATPIGLFSHYLAANPIPPPPGRSSRRPLVLVDGGGLAVDRVHQVLAGWCAQSHEAFDLVLSGGSRDVASAFDRIAVADERLRRSDDVAAVLRAGEERRAPIVLAEAGAVPHRHALGWLLNATERSYAWGAIADSVEESADGSAVRPVLRCAPDPYALRYGAPADVGTLLAEPPYADLFDPDEIGAFPSLLSNRLTHDPRLAHVAYPLFAVPRSSERSAPDASTASALPPPLPGRLAVIVPTRDNGSDVDDLVQSLRNRAAAPETIEIVVVDNGSRDPETLNRLARLEASGAIRRQTLDRPFNWSWLNNEAVRHTDAPLLLFANDDMLMLADGWDDEVRRLLADESIGAVGAHLHYDDGTIQHAGVLFGWKGSVIHDGLGEPADDPGPGGRRRHRRATSAVTGAFLATRRETFERVGGFDDTLLPVAYSDVDYCLKVRATGLAVLVTPEIRLMHHESKSRGLDHQSAERRARNAEERAVMERRWGAAFEMDATVNPHWVFDTKPWRLVRWPPVERVLAHGEKTGSGRTWVLPPKALSSEL